MQKYGIFCQFRSKLAITHTIAIKLKEKYSHFFQGPIYAEILASRVTIFPLGDYFALVAP